jgi:hypothetical protein
VAPELLSDRSGLGVSKRLRPPAASLAFGKDYLSDLVTLLEAIPRGEGDFCIGRQTHGNLALWFWWYPKAT